MGLPMELQTVCLSPFIHGQSFRDGKPAIFDFFFLLVFCGVGITSTPPTVCQVPTTRFDQRARTRAITRPSMEGLRVSLRFGEQKLLSRVTDRFRSRAPDAKQRGANLLLGLCRGAWRVEISGYAHRHRIHQADRPGLRERCRDATNTWYEIGI